MTIYLDSSALVKLYVAETESAAVVRLVMKRRVPLRVSLLHEIEVKNGLRLKAFRKEIPYEAIRGVLRHMEEDFTVGVLIRPQIEWPAVFETAESLSERFTRTVGCRSLDLLHVASAMVLKAQRFLTFDRRQEILARKAGLKLASIGSRQS